MDLPVWRYDQAEDADRKAEEAQTLLGEVESRPWPRDDRQLLLCLAGRMLLGAQVSTPALRQALRHWLDLLTRDLEESGWELRAEAARLQRLAAEVVDAGRQTRGW